MRWTLTAPPEGLTALHAAVQTEGGVGHRQASEGRRSATLLSWSWGPRLAFPEALVSGLAFILPFSLFNSLPSTLCPGDWPQQDRHCQMLPIRNQHLPLQQQQEQEMQLQQGVKAGLLLRAAAGRLAWEVPGMSLA